MTARLGTLGVTSGHVGHGCVTVTVKPVPVVVTGTKVTKSQVGQGCVTVTGGTRPTVTRGQEGHKLVTVTASEPGTVREAGGKRLELMLPGTVDCELLPVREPVDTGGATPELNETGRLLAGAPELSGTERLLVREPELRGIEGLLVRGRPDAVELLNLPELVAMGGGRRELAPVGIPALVDLRGTEPELNGIDRLPVPDRLLELKAGGNEELRNLPEPVESGGGRPELAPVRRPELEGGRLLPVPVRRPELEGGRLDAVLLVNLPELVDDGKGRLELAPVRMPEPELDGRRLDRVLLLNMPELVEIGLGRLELAPVRMPEPVDKVTDGETGRVEFCCGALLGEERGRPEEAAVTPVRMPVPERCPKTPEARAKTTRAASRLKYMTARGKPKETSVDI